MREEFFISRQGKVFVLYSGLLDEAHTRGLQKIKTEIVEKPHEMNNNTAIVKATVVMASADGEDGREFDGIGDANPNNVSRNIAPHLIRMAETRAKARALRDAVNVAMTTLEELGGDDETESATKPRKSSGNASSSDASSGDGSSRSSRNHGQTSSGKEKGELPATRKQLNYLEGLIPDVSKNGIPGFEEHVGKKLAELTRDEASEWIGRLSGRSPEGKAAE